MATVETLKEMLRAGNVLDFLEREFAPEIRRIKAKQYRIFCEERYELKRREARIERHYLKRKLNEGETLRQLLYEIISKSSFANCRKRGISIKGHLPTMDEQESWA